MCTERYAHAKPQGQRSFLVTLVQGIPSGSDMISAYAGAEHTIATVLEELLTRRNELMGDVDEAVVVSVV